MIIEDNVFAREYDLAFPEDDEYDAWIKSIENDMKKSGLVITNKTRVFADDDLSPFATVNS